MTDKDKELVRQAKALGYADFGIAFDLARQAETEEARQILHSIATSLYRTDEYHSGLL